MKLKDHQVYEMKEDMSYQEAIVAKVNMDRVETEKQVASLEVIVGTMILAVVRGKGGCFESEVEFVTSSKNI